MKKFLVFVVAVLFGLSISGLVFAGEQAPATEKPLSVKKEHVVSATATVEAIDLQKRVVTLKGPKGVYDVTVAEEVRNLPQVKVGDQVKVKYYESIALRLVKPGEELPAYRRRDSGRSKQERSRGDGSRQVTGTATITAIDKKSKW
jgi:hypothetical protein